VGVYEEEDASSLRLMLACELLDVVEKGEGEPLGIFAERLDVGGPRALRVRLELVKRED
jgi:hypothetical protein